MRYLCWRTPDYQQQRKLRDTTPHMQSFSRGAILIISGTIQHMMQSNIMSVCAPKQFNELLTILQTYYHIVYVIIEFSLIYSDTFAKHTCVIIIERTDIYTWKTRNCFRIFLRNIKSSAWNNWKLYFQLV